MTIRVRTADSIYEKEGGWFNAHWHFSFDDYHDREFMGFGTMRVFNDDRLIAGAVWPMHPHRDIEGLTYVAEGTFRHEDNVGGGGVLPAGSVQRMTLGSGAYHSEQNASETEPKDDCVRATWQMLAIPPVTDDLTVSSNRGDRIRTYGLLVPNQALYQAELRPVFWAFVCAGLAMASWGTT